MMALFMQVKKSLRSFPSVPMQPRVWPKATENTSKPTTLMPSEVPAIGATKQMLNNYAYNKDNSSKMYCIKTNNNLTTICS